MEYTKNVELIRTDFDEIFDKSLNSDWLIKNESPFLKKSEMAVLYSIMEESEDTPILGKNHVFLNYLISGVTKSLNYGSVYISGLAKILLRKIKQDGKIKQKSNVHEVIKNTTTKMLGSINNIKVKIEDIDDSQLDMLVNDLVTIITIIKILGDTLIQTASILINNQTQSRLSPFIKLADEFTKKLNEYAESISAEDNDNKKFNLKELTDYIEKCRDLSSELMSPIIPDTEDDKDNKPDEDDDEDYSTPALGVSGEEANESQIVYNDKYYKTSIAREKLPYYDPIRSPNLFTEMSILNIDENSPVFEINDLFRSDNELQITSDTSIDEAKDLLKIELEDVFDCFDGITNDDRMKLENALCTRLESVNDFQNIVYNIKEKLNGR